MQDDWAAVLDGERSGSKESWRIVCSNHVGCAASDVNVAYSQIALVYLQLMLKKLEKFGKKCA